VAEPADRDRFERALAAIDAANADDPNTVVARGELRPKEQAHADLMVEWVRRLDPEADEAQLLAARAHHLRRWIIPRKSYPDGRAGYLRWRLAARNKTSEDVAVVLAGAGYDQAVVGRVLAILRKEGRTGDAAVQTHEDALCLVFLETQLAEVTAQLGDDKTVEVIRKTANKMSSAGLAQTAGLTLDPGCRSILERALGTTP
jgi:Domain of unknown function (DUF4202)